MKSWLIIILIGFFIVIAFVLDDKLGAMDGSDLSTSTPRISPRTSIPNKLRDRVLLNVPFTPQAPFGDWGDSRQQDGCEEASALMAMRWVQNKAVTLAEAEKEIIAISDYEFQKYGNFHDTSVKDTIDRIFRGYFNYNNVTAKYDIDAEDIKNELSQGNLVIVPANGQKLKNPYYTPPGPLHHMLVIRGYDNKTGEFFTNDPGTASYFVIQSK